MKKFLARMLMPLCVAVICTTANADSRTLEVWTCKVNDGRSLDDVKSENGNWVKFVNRTVAGGDIESYVVTSIVGAQGQFLYVDSFPTMAAWIATKDAMSKGEGLAIEAALNEVATCESNSLYNSEQT
jgi:hypothetical protein